MNKENRNKSTDISARIAEILDYINESKNSFALKLGYERAQTVYDIINGKSAPSYDFFKKFQLSEYSDIINIDWLLIGRGSMLKSEGVTLMGEQVPTVVDEKRPEIQILHHPKVVDKVITQQSIPVYNVEAAANLKTIFSNKDQNLLGEITMPDIPRCDGAIYVRGDSMYPLLKSGDIVGYKEIMDFNNVIFGEMYIVSYDIEGDEYVCVKYVNHSDQQGYIKLVSYNPHHDPKDIPVNRITAMALVKFSIRMNTII